MPVIHLEIAGEHEFLELEQQPGFIVRPRYYGRFGLVVNQDDFVQGAVAELFELKTDRLCPAEAFFKALSVGREDVVSVKLNSGVASAHLPDFRVDHDMEMRFASGVEPDAGVGVADIFAVVEGCDISAYPDERFGQNGLLICDGLAFHELITVLILLDETFTAQCISYGQKGCSTTEVNAAAMA